MNFSRASRRALLAMTAAALAAGFSVGASATLATGATIEVAAHVDNLHIFDGTSGSALR